MLTRAAQQAKKDGLYKSAVLRNMSEQKPNMYYGQQICGFRDAVLDTDIMNEIENDMPLDGLLQEIYDMGCVIMTMKICTKVGDKYVLNDDFGDYYGWEHASDKFARNCELLRELGHPLFN